MKSLSLFLLPYVVIVRFEESPFSSRELIAAHQHELTQHFPHHKVSSSMLIDDGLSHSLSLSLSLSLQLQGFPIHICCFDTKQLLEEVELTALPHCEHEKAEFAMALHLHPYPGDVLSVWLYLVVMTPT